MRTTLRIALAAALFSGLTACGPKLPPRYVLEHDVGSYKFRRYQQVLDVELSLLDNAAVGHTATYVRGGKTVHVAPVFITVYQKPAGLVEEVRQRLRAMSGYTFDIVKLVGAHVYRMRGEGEDGDSWVLWVSGAQLVKLGAPVGERDVPGELLEAYLAQYPSDLDKQGKAIEGRKSAGPAASTGDEPSSAQATTK